jgi:hypothetical protein
MLRVMLLDFTCLFKSWCDFGGDCDRARDRIAWFNSDAGALLTVLLKYALGCGSSESSSIDTKSSRMNSDSPDTSTGVEDTRAESAKAAEVLERDISGFGWDQCNSGGI